MIDHACDPSGRLDVVVVNYETPRLLATCLESIGRFATADVREVIVVDNSVSTASADLVGEQFSDVRVIRPASNLGYGGGANLAIAGCTAEYVLVLNADTCLAEGCLAPLLAELDRHPECAVVGPRLVDGEGRTQPSCARFPTRSSVLLHETGLWKGLRWTPVGDAVRPFYEPADPGDVPWVLGAALALRRQPFLDVGGFDPAFFMYFEEVDLCRRLADVGETTRAAPASVVHHVGGASTSIDRRGMQRALYRSLATYLGRHGGRRRDRHRDRPGARPRLAGLRATIITVAVVRLIADLGRSLVARRPGGARSAVSGWTSVVADAWRGWPA